MKVTKEAMREMFKNLTPEQWRELNEAFCRYLARTIPEVDYSDPKFDMEI